MTQTSAIEPFDQNSAVADYRQQAREFLVKSRQYLAEDDLHQASEKGWGAAAWMAKAVSEAQGWQYRYHEQFNDVLNRARAQLPTTGSRLARLTGDPRLSGWRGIANDLHRYFYTRKLFLDAAVIREDLDHVSQLLDILEPLTDIDQPDA